MKALVCAMSVAWGLLPQVFRSETKAVLVDVAVSDGARSVEGLTTADFHLVDSGIQQRILSVAVDSQPLDVSILIDVSESAHRLLGVDSSGAARQLLRVFSDLDSREVLYFASQISDSPSQLPEFRSRGAWFGDRGTSLYDAVVASVVRPAREGMRRLVVVFTDGVDSSSYTSRGTRNRVVERSSATIYIMALPRVANGFAGHIDNQSGAQGLATLLNTELLMHDLVDRSGGLVYSLESGRAPVEALASAVAEFRKRYLLMFVPSGVEAAGWHPLVVTIPDHHYTVISKRGYVR